MVKRSYKNYNVENWNASLSKKDWSAIEKTNVLDEKVNIFTKLITESLDEVAPMKSFSIRTNHVFGLSEGTKEMMKKRDAARKKIGEVAKIHKTIWLTKYKKIRNQVNRLVRKDQLDFNNNRIDKAGDENEV